jgi:hypothetical protein
MTVSNVGGGGVQNVQTAPGSPDAALAKAILASLQSVDQNAAQASAAAARAGPVLTPDETLKGLALSKVQQLIQELKLIQKFYGGDPKGMAQALAQIFKQLKEALDEYRQATGEELSDAGLAVTEVTAPSAPASGPAATNTTASPATADAPATGADQTAPSGASAGQADSADTTAAPSLLTSGPKFYAAAVSALRDSIGGDGLDFVGQIRALVAQIKQKLLTPALIQAQARKPDKATKAAFEDADKALKALEDDMSVFEQDIRQAVPAAGSTLSLAA